MKKTIALIFSVFVWQSCAEQTQTAEAQNSETQEVEVSTVEKTAKDINIKPDNFVGYWMPEEYLLKVATKKSIYELDGDNSKEPLFGFIIEKSEPTLRGFGTHEGGLDAPLVWNENEKRFDVDALKVGEYHILQTGSYLEYKMETQIQIVTPEKTTVFRSVIDDGKELGKILLSGNYKNQNGENVTFSEDGKISGLGTKTQYKILSDFGEGLFFDVVFLRNPEDRWNEQEIYHFKIKENTLELYPVTGEFPDVEYEIGELKHKLTK